MKKLMIAAFAVAFAAVAQAAVCNWNTGALKTVDKDGKWTGTALYNSGSAVTAIAYIYSDSACTELVGQSSSSIITAGSTLGTKFNDIDNPAEYADLEFNKTYYVKIMMSGDFGNGTQTFLNTDAAAYTMPGKGSGSVKFGTVTGGLGIINTGSTTAQWSAVPEPTSGLLLLLGVAGLALKRKRA